MRAGRRREYGLRICGAQEGCALTTCMGQKAQRMGKTRASSGDSLRLPDESGAKGARQRARRAIR